MLVGFLSTPTEAADRARDARTLCDAERLGASILPDGSASKQRSIGLQQSAGALTTAAYRELLFDLLHKPGDATALELAKTLDVDIRAQGEAAWEACTLLVKK
jgi:hypothetical protein